MSEAVLTDAIRERFEVDNDMKAEWCLNKIRKARAEQQREKAELQRQMQFYKDQMELVDREADEEVAHFEAMLRPYFNSRVDEGFAKAAKTQVTYKLPTGKLVLKKQEPEYERTDGLLLEWVKKNRPELVKVEESVEWLKLKKQVKIDGNSFVTEDGEIIPGVVVKEREDKFFAEVK